MFLFSTIAAAIAALIHCYIFYLESFAWTAPKTRKVFGTTAEDAETSKSLAFNQGFYNLFFAIIVFLGIILDFAHPVVGNTLLFAGLGSMFAASLVLILSDRSKARAAAIQGIPPVVGLIFLILHMM